MPTLLVVDDSEIDRRLVAGLLRANANWHIETAADGSQGLARLDETPVDLVITDLQMPEMDGLELVKQISLRHEHVPVILMTAHGSESLAIEALESGAASYVPKSRLADMLEETVTQALSLAETDRNYERLVGCQTHAEFRFALDNDAALIDPLVDLIRQIAFMMGLYNANERFRVGTALQQAILNAIYHGNLELTSQELETAREKMLASPGADLLTTRRREQPYRDRKIMVEACITREKLEVKVADEGPGFDVSSAHALTNGASEGLDGARGLRLMRILMDEVRYNESGNEVLLVKYREQPVAV